MSHFKTKLLISPFLSLPPTLAIPLFVQLKYPIIILDCPLFFTPPFIRKSSWLDFQQVNGNPPSRWESLHFYCYYHPVSSQDLFSSRIFNRFLSFHFVFSKFILHIQSDLLKITIPPSCLNTSKATSTSQRILLK